MPGLWAVAERRDAVVTLTDSEEKADVESAGGAFGFIYASTNERWRLGSKQESDSVLGMNPPR